MTKNIDPLVSTAWLEASISDVLAVDLREPHLYAAGHIPGSISVPFSPMSDWAVSNDDLMLELPPKADLFAALGGAGIGPDSRVVLVGTIEPPPAPPYALADAPRAVATLHYIGVTSVAVLDGAYPLWEAEGRPVSTEPTTRSPREWNGPVREDMFVSTGYVKDHLGSVLLVDGRDASEYFGVSECPFAGVGGHIPSARSLPVPWIWEPDGTYKPVEVLRAMAEGVVGTDCDREIITYCGVGGYAATLWFLLTQILDYHNVKIYDGSAEAWVKTEEMVSYSW